jgi:putative ATP-binding cassette transporter
MINSSTACIAHGRYYQLNLIRGDHANPEYRIADDARVATESSVDFVSGITQALLSAVTFVAVLWSIDGVLDVKVVGFQLHIPCFLVIAALIFALVASGSLVGEVIQAASAFHHHRPGRIQMVGRQLPKDGRLDRIGAPDCVADVLPIILCAPKFLDGSMSLVEAYRKIPQAKRLSIALPVDRNPTDAVACLGFLEGVECHHVVVPCRS